MKNGVIYKVFVFQGDMNDILHLNKEEIPS